MAALEVKGLEKNYDNFQLKGISFDLDEGYILGYIGQNGAGKSTTINLIMDFIKKDAGQVKIFGRSVEDGEKEYRESIGYVSDECYFIDSMKCKDVKKALSIFYKSFDGNRFTNYLDSWNIKLESKVGSLSKGMKTKLMLASVLSRETHMLILDEPTSGLDPIFRAQILDVLQEYIVDGKRSVLFSTHILSDIEKVADYICFIMDGKLIMNDSTDRILESHYVIKGDVDDAGSIRDKLISYKVNRYGFEGIIKKHESVGLGGRFVLERPSIEEIMLGYSGMEGKNDKVF